MSSIEQGFLSVDAIRLKQQFFSQPDIFIGEIRQDPLWRDDGLYQDLSGYIFESGIDESFHSWQTARIHFLQPTEPAPATELLPTIQEITHVSEPISKENLYTVSIRFPELIYHPFEPNHFGVNITTYTYSRTEDAVGSRRFLSLALTDSDFSAGNEVEALQIARAQFGNGIRLTPKLPPQINIIATMTAFFEGFKNRTFKPTALIPA